MALYLGGQKVTPIIEGANNSLGQFCIGNQQVSFLRKHKESSGELHTVRVIDLDGTLLDEQQLNEGDTYTIPTPPTHPCLTFHEWVATKPITNNTVTVGKTNIQIGAVHKPSGTDGLYNFVVVIKTEYNNQTVPIIPQSAFNFNVGISCPLTYRIEDVDYGTIILSTFIFDVPKAGTYYIPFYSDYEALFTAGKSIKFFHSSSDMTNIVGFIYPSNVTGEFDCSKKMISSSTEQENSLKFIGYPPNVTSILAPRYHLFHDMDTIIIPNSVNYALSLNKYGTTASSSAENLKYFIANCVFYSTVSGANSTGIYYGAGVENFHMDKSNQVIGQNFFKGWANCLEYDFTDFESVPSLQGTDAFYGINPNCKIKVPAALEANWKAANNWSTYADYIVGV